MPTDPPQAPTPAPLITISEEALAVAESLAIDPLKIEDAFAYRYALHDVVGELDAQRRELELLKGNYVRKVDECRDEYRTVKALTRIVAKLREDRNEARRENRELQAQIAGKIGGAREC